MKKYILPVLIIVLLAFWLTGGDESPDRIGPGMAALVGSSATFYCELLHSPFMEKDSAGGKETPGEVVYFWQLVRSFDRFAEEDLTTIAKYSQKSYVAAIALSGAEGQLCLILHDPDGSIFKALIVSVSEGKQQATEKTEAGGIKVNSQLWKRHIPNATVFSPTKSGLALNLREMQSAPLSASKVFRKLANKQRDRGTLWGFSRGEMSILIPSGVASGNDGKTFTFAISSSKGKISIHTEIASTVPESFQGAKTAFDNEEKAGITLWDILFTLIMIPVVIVGIFLLLIIILALYYYIEAWLSGNVYAKNIPEPAVLSPSAKAILGLTEVDDSNEEKPEKNEDSVDGQAKGIPNSDISEDNGEMDK